MAEIVKGHERGLKYLVERLEEFGLPLGLLPLENVMKLEFVRNTGYMKILQKKTVRGKLVSCDTEIRGNIKKKLIRDLEGVKVKKDTLWHPVNQIIVDDPTGKILFKISPDDDDPKTFLVEDFAAAGQ